MIKIVKSKEESPILYSFEFLVDRVKHSLFKEKIIAKLSQDIDIPGYRPGKAPLDRIIAKIGKEKVDQTILSESLQKYTDPALDLSKKELVGKKVASFQFDINPENTREENDGFRFKIFAHLLPEINLSEIKKLRIKEPEAKDAKDQPTYKDFEKEELAKIVSKYAEYKAIKRNLAKGDKIEFSMAGKVDGQSDPRLITKNFTITIGEEQFIPGFEEELVKAEVGKPHTFVVTFPENYFEKTLAKKEAEFTIEVKKAERPKSNKIEAIIKSSPELQKQFQTEKEVKEYIRKFYNARIEKSLEEIRQRTILQTVVDKSENFALPEEKILSEIERIVQHLEKDAEKQKQTIGQNFAKSGLPGSDIKGCEKFDLEKVKKYIDVYVRKEFKLSALLSYIYSELPEEEKIKPAEMDEVVAKAFQNKSQYNIPENSDEERVRDIVTDRMVRQSAANWLYSQFPKHETKPVVVKKVEKKK